MLLTTTLPFRPPILRIDRKYTYKERIFRDCFMETALCRTIGLIRYREGVRLQTLCAAARRHNSTRAKSPDTGWMALIFSGKHSVATQVLICAVPPLSPSQSGNTGPKSPYIWRNRYNLCRNVVPKKKKQIIDYNFIWRIMPLCDTIS